MVQLPKNYDFLKTKKIRIISIAADENQEQFNTTANKLPWSDKYFDYGGLIGLNFKNYAILGTPTIFLIDDLGKIEAKLANLNEVLELLK